MDAQADPDEVLARVGDEEITRGQVAEAAGEQLDQIEKQLTQCRMEATQNRHQVYETQTRALVRERLLNAEAETRGMTQDQLLQAEVQSQSGQITDAEIDAFYQANQNRIPRPKEEVAGQIRQYLQQQRESRGVRGFHRVAGEAGPGEPTRSGPTAPRWTSKASRPPGRRTRR